MSRRSAGHIDRVPDAPLYARGQTFEEVVLGSRFRTAARTITEADLVAFVGMAGMFEPAFMDVRDPPLSGFKGRLIPGPMTFVMAEGLVCQTNCIQGTGMAFMHCELDAVQPLYVGNTIDVIVEVIECRKASRGERGVVTTRNTVRNEHGDTVYVYSPVRLIKGNKWRSARVASPRRK